jgi:hypothetical protein
MARREEEEVLELVSALSQFLGLTPGGQLEDIRHPTETFTRLRQRFSLHINKTSDSEALLASLPQHRLLQVPKVRQIILHLPALFLAQLQATPLGNVPYVLLCQLRARIFSTDGPDANTAPVHLDSSAILHEHATTAPSPGGHFDRT